MNDRALAVLEKYDIEVLRSWKGRGAILCETKTGIKILREYKGSPERLLTQQKILDKIEEKGFFDKEKIIPTKEGELLVKDEDMNTYHLKEYSGGKECNLKEAQESCKAIENLALLHNAMELPDFVKEENLRPFSLPEEFEKHNRELRKVRKYLKEKKQKNDFEYFLYQNYTCFLEKAEKILEEVKGRPELFSIEKLQKQGTICHGDFQHHNTILSEGRVYIINFDKYILDNPMRDFCLFFRKMMEKNSWSIELGQYILQRYEAKRFVSEEDRYQLYYRLSYPEKFWKLVNFYYNTPKVWIPSKNMEKLDKMLKQEEEKNIFLEWNLKEWVLHKSKTGHYNRG